MVIKMVQYWEMCPGLASAAEKSKPQLPPSLVKCGLLLKDFHCHHECIAKQDKTREAKDWQSEL
jgi:hypothetical protein